MKIKCKFTIEVDEKAWALEYGLDPSEVRDDVKAYSENFIKGQIEALGLEKSSWVETDGGEYE